MKKIAIIFTAHDGISSLYNGVGVLTQFFIGFFPDIRKKFLENGIQLDLYLMGIELDSNSVGFSDSLLEKSIDISKKCGGDVFLLENGTNKKIQYGSIANWELVSKNASDVIRKIIVGYDDSLVICTDTPFLKIPLYLSDIPNHIKFVINLHSNYFIHFTQNNLDRLNWEKEAFNYFLSKSNVYIGNTSDFLTKSLTDNFQVNTDQIIPLRSGIYKGDEKYNKIDSFIIENYLKKLNIPINKKLIFSVGRANPCKGFDILIEAFSRLETDAHLVFIASRYTNDISVKSELSELIKKFKLEHKCTPIFEGNFLLPSYIYQWKNTKLAVQLSRQEPFGLVPEEVRQFSLKADNDLVILTSNRDGFSEQITDGLDGFTIELEDIEKITKKIDFILNLNSIDRKNIVINGGNTLNNIFDYKKNIFSALNLLIQ